MWGCRYSQQSLQKPESVWHSHPTQKHWQKPPAQTSDGAHWTKHPPQLKGSDVGSTQTPPQGMNGKMHGLLHQPVCSQVHPSGQAHTPPQPSPPHHPAGQFPWQPPTQAPWEQFGVDPPQMLPQAPQLLGSELRLVQIPLHRVAPATHW